MIEIKIYKRKVGYEIEIPTDDDLNGNEYYCVNTLDQAIEQVSRIIEEKSDQ